MTSQCISGTREGWTPRNEALLEAIVRQAKVTRHPWLIACDANTHREDFEKGADVCCGPEIHVDMQIKKPKRRVDRKDL